MSAYDEKPRHRTRHNSSELNSQPCTVEGRPTYAIWRRSALKPSRREIRKHSEKQIIKIMASIRRFGFVFPILVDEEGNIACGVGRFIAAERLGIDEIPVLCASYLSKSELRVLSIADDKLAEFATWDEDEVRAVLSELLSDPDINLELTGLTMTQIDLIFATPEPVIPDPDALPPLQEAAVTCLGDSWALEQHSLVCGDSTKTETFDLLLGDIKVRLTINDPPYNCAVADISGFGKKKHREFAMGIGEMSFEQFTTFLIAFCRHIVSHSVDGSLHYIWMDHKHVEELAVAGRTVFTERKNICVWVKDNAGMGSQYRSQHELVFVLKHGTAPHINNINLGAEGRYRTNVLEYPGANSFCKGKKNAALKNHPTPKPVPLIADLIRDSSNVDDPVLDCFVGSGTIFIAAETTHRRAYGIELDPLYCDMAIERWQAFTGKEAILRSTGKTFGEMKEMRRPATPGGLVGDGVSP